MRRLILILMLLMLAAPCHAANWRAEIVVPFTGAGTHEDPYRPDIDAYAVDKMEDKTGTPGENIVPSPNTYIIQVETDNMTLDLMQQNGIIELWREEIVDPIGPGASLWNTLSDFLLPSAYAQSTSASAVGNKDEKPKRAVMQKLRQDLKAKGIKDADLDKTELKDVNKDSTKTRKEISEELRSVMKNFPKAK